MIVATWNELSPHTIRVLLPAVGAPTCRPLTEDDLLSVTWTVDHPEDDRVASWASAMKRKRLTVRRDLGCPAQRRSRHRHQGATSAMTESLV
jgi:hypothetical protein